MDFGLLIPVEAMEGNGGAGDMNDRREIVCSLLVMMIMVYLLMDVQNHSQ